MATIAHLSDIHFGDACPDRLDAAIAAVNALAPDCIVITGDLTQAGRRREFAAAKAWLARFRAPVVACPGNHDAPVYSIHMRFSRPFARFAQLGAASTWRDPAQTVGVHAINTARAAQWRLDWSQGRYARADVDTALSGLCDVHWRVLAGHHPPRIPASCGLADGTRGATSALRNLPERVVLLAGHVHGAYRMAPFAREGLVVLTAPTLASSRARSSETGFLVHRFSTTNLESEVWTYRAGAFAPRQDAWAA